MEISDAYGLRQMAEEVGRRRAHREHPLLGGAVGFVSYEAGAWFERMPAPRGTPALPLTWWGEVVAVEPVGPAAPAPIRRGVAPGFAADAAAAYQAGVRTILAHVRRGDVYQANLAREIVVAAPAPPATVWARLQQENPARRAMWLHTPDFDVVSNSPETLLAVRGRRLRSVPIKGTAPYGSDPQALLRSAKERAELTMIVDLVRADLARVARPGSVAAGPRRVGRVGHVWHAMQAVEAELDEGRSGFDALAALFPAGSVTGAPKVRAMEVIQALEPGPRGVYCGSMGVLLPGGDARWSVAIRTISFAGGVARYHVGAGIVQGSDPAREWAEIGLKAQKMAEALT